MDTEAADIWRLEICPECGYALEGLPQIGNCPECGKLFDRSRIVLIGWGGKVLRDGWRSWMGIAFCATAIAFVIRQWARGQPVDPFTVIQYGGLVGAIIISTLARWTSHRPALTQVCINATGCSQRDDVGVDDGNIWSRIRQYFELWYLLLSIPVGMAWLFWKDFGASRERRIGLIFVTIVIFIAIVILTVLRRGNARAKMHRIKPTPVTVVPWAEILQIKIVNSRSGWKRLKVRVSSTSVPWPINADVQCSDEGAERLRRITNSQIENSHATPVTRAQRAKLISK